MWSLPAGTFTNQNDRARARGESATWTARRVFGGADRVSASWEMNTQA